MPRTLAALLLAALALAAGCADRPGGEAPRPAAGASGARFARSGMSRDLLCALASGSAGAASPVPAKLASAPEACTCGGSTPACRVVGTYVDRRRSLLLAPGSRVGADVAVPDGASLRFSAMATGPMPTAFAVRVVAVDPTTGQRHQWEQRVGLVDRWVEGSIDLGGLGGRSARLQVEIGSGPRPEARLALGIPRLVVPASRDAGATNAIVYLIDTLRADHTSPYGYARPTTPRLAALADGGLVFENGYSIASWTRPAVASLLTGFYPAAHGVHTHSGLPDRVSTLAERFRAAGWSTAAFVANGHVLGETLNFEQGFDRFLALRGKKLDNHARTEEIDEHLFPYLAERGDEPFLIYVHAVDPHSPYDPPPAQRGRFTDPAYDGPITPEETVKQRLRARDVGPADLAQIVGLYDEDILYQDERLGALVDRLAALGLDRSTVLVVVADHGEEFHEHGDWAHGERLWQEVVRIPLVIRAPGASDLAGRRVGAPVQIVDVMPTLLSWFGVPGIEACQGSDLGPLLGAPGTFRRFAYLEEDHPKEGYDLLGLVDGRWKIIRKRLRSDGGVPAAPAEPDRLFDLADDPRERLDLASSAPRRLARMQKRLARAERRLGRAPGGAPGVEVRLDEATRRQLEALGYVDEADTAPGRRTDER